MPYHLMVRQKDNEFLDGNETYPYLPEGFLLGDTEIEELRDWHSRWERTSDQTFDPKEIAFGPYRRTEQQKLA